MLAADFTVTSTNSSGPGSLFQAITDANNTAEANRILFNISGDGVHRIDVSQNPLPPLMRDLVIDGYSQPGAKSNTLSVGDNAVILIQIDGSGSKVPLTGLTLSGIMSPRGEYFPAHYTIKGLSLTGFAAQEPLPPGYCGPDKVRHSYAISVGTVYSAAIVGNFIGLLPDGETPVPNDRGILLPGHPDSTMTVNNTVVGGSDLASRNVISGQSDYGVSGGGMVQGNYVGTNAKGTKAIANAIGIQADNVMIIGGTAAGVGNLISGNATAVQVGGFNYCMGAVSSVPSAGVLIQGNWIGVASVDLIVEPNGYYALPNGSSITIAGSNNVITHNLIKFNDSGVIVMSGTGNQISQNAISLNRGLGIDLGGDGVTPNDTNDVDSGPNNLQNFPLITSASITAVYSHGIVSGYFAKVGGTLQSTPNSTFRIELFANFVAGPLGYGEGRLYYGAANVSTDANGNASFSITSQENGNPGYRAFSVTATDSSGNTSEFSPAFFPAAKLLNLSTRTAVGTGENVSIGGFIVAGTEDKKVLLRGLGPSLTQAGVNGVLADPTLELRDATGALAASNDNWRDTQEREISQTGLAPADDAEAAILATLPSKPASQGGTAYTGILAGSNGKTGIGLLEIYDLGAAANSKLVNISTRGLVGAGEAVLIGGLIPGPTDNSAIRVLIRGIGPSLSAHGVSSPLADPVLELRDTNGNTLVENDNWSEAYNASEISATGIQPTDSRESAILTGLGPASGYTAIVRGANGGTGIALVEVYALN
jgi:hypothetical protein